MITSTFTSHNVISNKWFLCNSTTMINLQSYKHKNTNKKYEAYKHASIQTQKHKQKICMLASTQTRKHTNTKTQTKNMHACKHTNTQINYNFCACKLHSFATVMHMKFGAIQHNLMLFGEICSRLHVHNTNKYVEKNFVVFLFFTSRLWSKFFE